MSSPCGGAWLLWKHGDVTFVDRFAAAWAALGSIGLLLYPGARAADALWVVVPLTMLASYGITQLMVNRRVVILWSNAEDENGEDRALYTTRYWWVKWAISAGVLLCLFVLSVQFMQVARLMAEVPAGTPLAEAVTLSRKLVASSPGSRFRLDSRNRYHMCRCLSARGELLGHGHKPARDRHRVHLAAASIWPRRRLASRRRAAALSGRLMAGAGR